MIFAVIGSTNQDIETVALELSQSTIQVVDTLELLRNFDSKMVGSLTTREYHQKYVISKLESEFGSVIITGNIVLNEDICKWIIESKNGIVLIASRESLEKYDMETIKRTERYWADKSSQKYNLEERFKKLYERLSKTCDSKHLYIVDVSESDDIDLIKSLNNDIFSTKYVNSYEDILELVEVRKDENSMGMTMEESIKKAMRELGMEVDEGNTSTEVKTHLKKENRAKKRESKHKPVTKPEPESEPEVVEDNSDNTEQESSIFVKVTEDTMALLIPEGIEFETQEISGVKFKVATVPIPDLSNRNLQELSVVSVKTDGKIERAPSVSDRSSNHKEKPISASGDIEDIEELQKEKSRLDAAIKKARADGDIDKVNELRKQRRSVRNKINSLR